MAQDCLKILNRKPFFKVLVTKSACLNWKANLKANLGYESSISAGQSGTDEDAASQTTRETRNSAVSNDFGPISSSCSSQGPTNFKPDSETKKTD